MVTSGPLSELELQSKIVKTVSTSLQQHHDTPGPPLVHILLDNLGKRQRFTYPTDQCDWWFVSVLQNCSCHLLTVKGVAE